jgi:hypothetical protein
MPEIKEVLAERGAVHGSWPKQAACANMIKEEFRRANWNWDKLTRTQQESLDLIATKISRILTGANHHFDHWLDIVGYAQLEVNILNRIIEADGEDPRDVKSGSGGARTTIVLDDETN